MKRAQKDEIIRQMIEATQDPSSYPGTELSSDELRKISRYAKAIERMRLSVEQTGKAIGNLQDSQTSALTASCYDLSTTVRGPGELEQGRLWCNQQSAEASVTCLGASLIGTPDTSLDSSAQSKIERPIVTGSSSSTNLLYGGMSSTLHSPISAMDQHSSPDCLNLEIILQCIHVSYANASFCSNLHNKIQSQVTLIETPEIEFWAELKHGIYLLKVSQTSRALPILRKAGDSAAEALVQRPHNFVMELLSTLSPVNTSVCPGLRISLLRGLSDLARTHMGASHPITILTRELQKDITYREISERGLAFIKDIFTAFLGLSHTYTFDAERALVRLLRRSGNNDRALDMAQQVFVASRNASGDGSLRARKAGRELEHVLMDMNDWGQALEVCMTIVGQSKTMTGIPKPQYNDECAVHTMEDIAKIYGQLEDLKSSLAWLKQAAICAWTLWGDWVATQRIVDKLVATLKACGELAEVDFWQLQFLANGIRGRQKRASFSDSRYRIPY